MALSISWLLERANRKLNASGLSPEVARRTREVIREMHTQGIYVGVAQGYRSIAEQNRLYAQGRTTPGSIVTNARGGQSNHNRGIAVDLFQYSKDGTQALFRNDPAFQTIVTAMKRRGFSWGGDWTSFKDYPHFELLTVSKGTTKESAIVPYPGRPLYQGAANMNPRDIERIQRAVKSTVTRRFDAETVRKVRAYQTRQGLDVDGVVGPTTWNRMF
ncbi:M15 family metallopeptidase [Exiguobacterium acetylicum]|uniref:M15 family metallopeptidase n=1 Tax=Exiguobacterium acetylicum TaxID=41170 RepID=UPI001EE29B8B|nr:M15 family metallopeptidase [Exiguobacterium acetylicum]UKS56223.1 M15 family metallopeptidase [Exiguobacterium acetylicum]